MTELQITGFATLIIILILTNVWALMMMHNDLNHIWSVQVKILEILKKCDKSDALTKLEGQ